MPIIQQSDFDNDPRIAVLPSCQSTNTLLLNIAAGRQPMPNPQTDGWGWPPLTTQPTHGLVLTTNHQTAGRGRRGNSWEAQPGLNLTFSLLWHTQSLPKPNAWQLQTAFLLAITEALEAMGVPELQIKWPNDIYYKNQKIAGVLLDAVTRDGNVPFFVAGAGVNVNQTIFKTGNYASVCRALGHPASIPNLLWDIIDWTDRYFFGLQCNRNQAFNVLYNQKLLGKNSFVRILPNNNQEAIEAFLLGVNTDGMLLCRLTNGHEKTFAPQQARLIVA